jgi:hypothetical protein
LWPVIRENPKLRLLIEDKDLFPPDHMDQRPIKLLFALLDEVKPFANNNAPLKAFLEYLEKYVD